MSSYIQDKLFTDGFNLGAPLFVQGGVNGKYVIAANQIAWGDESYFNGAKFGGTTVGLLSAIEAACAGLDPEQVNQIIKDYLDENGVSIPEEYITGTELSAMSYITANDVKNNIPAYYITEDELAAKKYITLDEVPAFEIPSYYITETELSAMSYITAADIPAYYITETELEAKNYITAADIPDFEIPSYYITETELSQMGYLTSIVASDLWENF